MTVNTPVRWLVVEMESGEVLGSRPSARGAATLLVELRRERGDLLAVVPVDDKGRAVRDVNVVVHYEGAADDPVCTDTDSGSPSQGTRPGEPPGGVDAAVEMAVAAPSTPGRNLADNGAAAVPMAMPSPF
jgi:hypothetical protein